MTAAGEVTNGHCGHKNRRLVTVGEEINKYIRIYIHIYIYILRKATNVKYEI